MAPECVEVIEWDELACRAHWYDLPFQLRAEIRREWRSRPGGRLHKRAIRQAERLLRNPDIPPI